MINTYRGCTNLTTAVCGDNVVYMKYTYFGCTNLTSAVCGPNVTNMHGTYSGCTKLTTAPVIGPNVTFMNDTFKNCSKLQGDIYIQSPNVTSMLNCFYGKNNSLRCNIHVPANSLTFNTVIKSTNRSTIVYNTITFTNNAGVYYNSRYNIYIY
jgi:hypothetical protein